MFVEVCACERGYVGDAMRRVRAGGDPSRCVHAKKPVGTSETGCQGAQISSTAQPSQTKQQQCTESPNVANGSGSVESGIKNGAERCIAVRRAQPAASGPERGDVSRWAVAHHFFGKVLRLLFKAS